MIVESVDFFAPHQAPLSSRFVGDQLPPVVIEQGQYEDALA